MQKSKKYKVECVFCKKITENRKNRKYCNTECWRAHQKSNGYINPRANYRACALCGKETFDQKHKNRDGSMCENQFCSPLCYSTHRDIIKLKRLTECSFCAKMFVSPSKAGGLRVYCGVKCRNAHIMPKPDFCVNCGQMFVPFKQRGDGTWLIKGGVKTCSPRCTKLWASNNQDRKDKISKAMQGAKHPLWLGGQIGYYGDNWREQKRKIYKRDKNCIQCAMTNRQSLDVRGSGLEVHHIIKFRLHESWQEANLLSNLILLCKSCHQHAEHNGLKRRARIYAESI